MNLTKIINLFLLKNKVLVECRFGKNLASSCKGRNKNVTVVVGRNYLNSWGNSAIIRRRHTARIILIPPIMFQ